MRLAPAIAASVVILCVGVLAWPFTVDDAFIVARYAESWVAGDGWAMNPGRPSDGITGPLWVLPMAASIGVGLDPLAVAKALGLGAGALAAWLAVREAARRSGGRLAAPVAAAVVCTQANLAVWAVAGLSTGLATLLITVAVLCARGRRAAPWVVGAAVGALAWLRPELLPAGLVAVLWVVRARPRTGWSALALAVTGIASVIAWRLACFGSPVPLSFHAKPADLGAGVEYVLRGLLVLTAVVGLIPAVIASTRRRRDRLLALVLGVHVASVLVAGGDWMPGFRLLVPIIPLWALLVGDGAALFWRDRRPSARGRVQMGLVLLAVCGLGAADLAVQLPAARDAGRARQQQGAALAERLASEARVVALVDVGYLGWASGVEVVDLGGLTDPTVANRPGGHVSKEIDPGWLAARDPDLILLHSAVPPRVTEDGALHTLAGFAVERRLARMPWVRAHYEVADVVRYAPSYHYAVLRRRPGEPPRD